MNAQIINSEGRHLEKYFSGANKYYFVPTHTQKEFGDRLGQALGHRSDSQPDLFEVFNSIAKASQSHCSHLKIPFTKGLSESWWASVQGEVERQSLALCIQVTTSQLACDGTFQALKSFDSRIEYEWVFDRLICENVRLRWNELLTNSRDKHCSIVIFPDQELKQIIDRDLRQHVTEVHCYFPYTSEVGVLSCHQIHRLMNKLSQCWPEIAFLPPKGCDNWDERVDSELNLQAFFEPCYQSQSTNPQVQYSVVIPSFNNKNYLLKVLQQLITQDIGVDRFEIIVVDDGSTDGSQCDVIEWVDNCQQAVNFKYIYFPRSSVRYMGDGQYRAGVSRNLGAKNAVGEILCFLDSDILVPSDYLSEVGGALKTAQGVQARRKNLSQWVSQRDQLSYDEVVADKHIVPDETYWEEFISSSQDWNQRPSPWKYVCTHSFSMKAELFWQLGGLKHNYIFYGFEDTDLGYRMVRAGHQLKLLDVEVYHLFHQDQRSEFANSSYRRFQLLKKTAQIFYRHHLDNEIFNNLQIYLVGDLSLKSLLWGLVKLLTLGFIWWPSTRCLRRFSSMPWARF